MDHKTNIPQRLMSAPLSKNTPGVRPPTAFGGSKLPSRGPRPLMKTPSPPKKEEEEKEIPKEAADVAAPETTAAAAKGPLDDYYPENRVYEVSKAILLKNAHSPVAEAIMEYARNLWKEMPENKEMLSVNAREALFKDNNITMPSKVLVERKIHNEVMGILGKVTDMNMAKMKKELTDLPIRQSTEEEVGEVIRVFFTKSTRPEDSQYTPLYVKLLHHLLTTIGETENAGKYIRTQLMERCRDTFMTGNEHMKELDEQLLADPSEAATLARMQYAAVQKCNLRFLGLLFTSGMASERVVLVVLTRLIHGPGNRRYIPPDFALDNFMQLLVTIGPFIKSKDGLELIERFRRILTDLSASHPSQRIKFLILNFLETMENNWVPVRGRGAVLTNRAARPPPPPIPEPKIRIPTKEEFWKAMDDFFPTSSVDEIIPILNNVKAGGSELVVEYCSRWLGRIIVTYRYATERSRAGELFEHLINKNTITREECRDALLRHAHLAVVEDLFTDQPKYFTHWAEVIRNGRNIFTTSLHTELLDLLVEHNVRREAVTTMIRDVTKALEDTKEKDKEYQPRERFRILQALLRYRPPLLDPEADVARPPADGDDAEEEEDIFTEVRKLDIETELFLVLCDNYENRVSALQDVMEAIKKGQLNAYPLLSACFTFMRFDVEGLGNSHKDVLKKLLTLRTPASLLEEVYVQWEYLHCARSSYYAFVKKVQPFQTSVKNDGIEKLKDRLRTEHAAGAFVSEMEQYLKAQ